MMKWMVGQNEKNMRLTKKKPLCLIQVKHTEAEFWRWSLVLFSNVRWDILLITKAANMMSLVCVHYKNYIGNVAQCVLECSRRWTVLVDGSCEIVRRRWRSDLTMVLMSSGNKADGVGLLGGKCIWLPGFSVNSIGFFYRAIHFK